VFLVIREMRSFWICLAVVVATSWFLKVNWYNKLPSAEADAA